MRQKNHGETDAFTAQCRFTAYLQTAIRNRKAVYAKEQQDLQQSEIMVDFMESSFPDMATQDMLKGLPLLMQMENANLLYALNQLSERDRNIVFGKILGGWTFDELSAELGLRYKCIASAYQRAMKKLREELGGDDK